METEAITCVRWSGVGPKARTYTERSPSVIASAARQMTSTRRTIRSLHIEFNHKAPKVHTENMDNGEFLGDLCEKPLRSLRLNRGMVNHNTLRPAR